MSCPDGVCPMTPGVKGPQGVTYLTEERKQQPSDGPSTGVSRLSPSMPQIRRQVYEGVIQHFGDIKMAKIPCDDPRYSMYGAQVPCMCAEKRFIFAIALPDRNPYGAITLLSRINWVSFQTRTSVAEYSVPVVSYESKQTVFGSTAIKMVRDEEINSYYRTPQVPIEIQLIQGSRGYSTEGTITDALETYATIIYFV